MLGYMYLSVCCLSAASHLSHINYAALHMLGMPDMLIFQQPLLEQLSRSSMSGQHAAQ